MSYQSYTETVFESARGVFGKDVYKAWPQIAFEYEHALWRVWNQNYGPLNDEQLWYSVDLICHALSRAKGSPNPYAVFKAQMRRLYNHETVDRGFKARAEKPAPGDLQHFAAHGFRPVTAA